jgi:hypothetical protein
VNNHANNPDTINAPAEKTIINTPPTISLVMNGECGTNIETPSHIKTANVAKLTRNPMKTDVNL